MASLAVMLWLVGLELGLLGHAWSAAEANAGVSGWLQHVRVHHHVQLVHRLLAAHARHLLVPHLLHNLIAALSVLNHVLTARQRVLGVRGRSAARKRTNSMVLRATRDCQLIIPRINLHIIQLMMLIVFLDERLLLSLLLKLLVRLLLMDQIAAESYSGSARLIVIVAQVYLHGRLLRSLRLVRVGRHCQNVDLLVQARALVEMLIEAAVPALAALV